MKTPLTELPTDKKNEAIAPVDQPNAPKTDKAARRKYGLTSDNLAKFLLRVSGDIEALDRARRLRAFRTQIKAHQYYDGNFYGYVDENCEWVSCQREDAGEQWFSDNQFYPYIRTALMELSRRQTDIAINPATPGEQMEKVAKLAQERYDANRDRTFTAHLKQTEDTFALLNGIVFRYTYFDYGSGRKEKLPRLKKKSPFVDSTDTQANPTDKTSSPTDNNVLLCAGCARLRDGKASGDAMDELDTPCPNCGETAVKVLPNDERADLDIDYDEVNTGENVWISPNPVGIVVSMQASCIEESPFLKWKQMVLRSVLEERFSNTNLPSTGTESLELRYIASQKVATPSYGTNSLNYQSASGSFDTMDGASATSETGGGRELELLEFQQIWLDFPVYCNVKFDEAQTLSDGSKIPANTPLGDLFPDGMYYAKVGNVIVDIWNESKNKKWVSSPYSLRAGSMYGHGTSAAHQNQEIINDTLRLTIANAWANGVPREFVDPTMIPELSADPREITEIRNPDGIEVNGRGYFQAPVQALSGEVYQIAEKAAASMQNQIGAMSTGEGGLADTQAWGNTATAIATKRDLAVGRFAPDLELLADNLDRRQAYQFLENEQKNFTSQQWEKVKGDYGDDAVDAFLKCDVYKDLTVTVVPGSYMPKTEAQLQSKLLAFVTQVMPVLAQFGNKQQMDYAMEVFGLPQALTGWDTDRAHASQICERFKILADQFVQQYGDTPDIDLINDGDLKEVCDMISEHSQIPVDVFLDNHQAIIDALTEWNGTDAGRSASNVLKASITNRAMKHQEAIFQRQAVVSGMQMVAEKPVQDAAAQQQIAQQAQAAQAQAQVQGQAQQQQQAAQMQMQQQAQAQQMQQQAPMMAAQQQAQQQQQQRGEDMHILSGMSQLHDAAQQRQHEKEIEAMRSNAEIEKARIEAKASAADEKKTAPLAAQN